jgi:hypothetical protein
MALNGEVRYVSARLPRNSDPAVFEHLVRQLAQQYGRADTICGSVRWRMPLVEVVVSPASHAGGPNVSYGLRAYSEMTFFCP